MPYSHISSSNKNELSNYSMGGWPTFDHSKVEKAPQTPAFEVWECTKLKQALSQGLKVRVYIAAFTAHFGFAQCRV
jgi:hypothetical protein